MVKPRFRIFHNLFLLMAIINRIAQNHIIPHKQILMKDLHLQSNKTMDHLSDGDLHTLVKNTVIGIMKHTNMYVLYSFGKKKDNH